MKRIFLVLLLFIFTLVAFYGSGGGDIPKTTINVTKTLESIPSKDRDVLDNFFHKILIEDGFAYVLFDSKPIATAAFSQLIPESERDPINITVKNGWETWEKYKDRFPLKKYIFRIVGNLDTDQTIKIILINKKRFSEEIQKHAKVFQEVFGETFNSADLLQSFKINSDPFKNILKKHHILIGILHGFGNYNSALFEEKWKRMQALKATNCFSCQEELEMFDSDQNQINPFESKSAFIKLPKFYCDPTSQETLELLDNFRLTQKEIEMIYQKGDFLKTTLEKLTAEDN